LRAVQGKPPYKSLEEVKDDATASILLEETAQIAADFALLNPASQTTAPTQAQRMPQHGATR